MSMYNDRGPGGGTAEFRAVKAPQPGYVPQPPTQTFQPIAQLSPTPAGAILARVNHALQAKGYDPTAQLVGYLLSGDPTYITSHEQARSMICRLERDEILEELVQHYLDDLERLV